MLAGLGLHDFLKISVCVCMRLCVCLRVSLCMHACGCECGLMCMCMEGRGRCQVSCSITLSLTLLRSSLTALTTLDFQQAAMVCQSRSPWNGVNEGVTMFTYGQWGLNSGLVLVEQGSYPRGHISNLAAEILMNKVTSSLRSPVKMKCVWSSHTHMGQLDHFFWELKQKAVWVHSPLYERCYKDLWHIGCLFCHTNYLIRTNVDEDVRKWHSEWYSTTFRNKCREDWDQQHTRGVGLVQKYLSAVHWDTSP